MKRYEIILTLKGLEETVTYFKSLLNDVQDYYFKTGCFSVQLTTNQYDNKRKYNGELMIFDKDLFSEYLKKEIAQLESKIAELIKELTEAK